MKIRHRIPTQAFASATDPLSAEYEAEVRACTERAERAYRLAEQRLAKAIAKAEEAERKAKVRKVKPSVVADLWAIVELRRIELDAYARVMAASPQSAAHRGGKSFRPVPVAHGMRP